MLSVPLTVRAPFQPALLGLLEPVHDVGLLVAFQLIVALLPVVMAIGLRVTVTTGVAGTVTVNEMLVAWPVPPAFVQSSEK